MAVIKDLEALPVLSFSHKLVLSDTTTVQVLASHVMPRQTHWKSLGNVGCSLPKLVKCLRYLRSNVLVSVMSLSFEWVWVSVALRACLASEISGSRDVVSQVDFSVGVMGRWFCPAPVLVCYGDEIRVCMINFFHGVLHCKSSSGWQEDRLVCSRNSFRSGSPWSVGISPERSDWSGGCALGIVRWIVRRTQQYHHSCKTKNRANVFEITCEYRCYQFLMVEGVSLRAALGQSFFIPLEEEMVLLK